MPKVLQYHSSLFSETEVLEKTSSSTLNEMQSYPTQTVSQNQSPLPNGRYRNIRNLQRIKEITTFVKKSNSDPQASSCYASQVVPRVRRNFLTKNEFIPPLANRIKDTHTNDVESNHSSKRYVKTRRSIANIPDLHGTNKRDIDLDGLTTSVLALAEDSLTNKSTNASTKNNINSLFSELDSLFSTAGKPTFMPKNNRVLRYSYLMLRPSFINVGVYNSSYKYQNQHEEQNNRFSTATIESSFAALDGPSLTRRSSFCTSELSYIYSDRNLTLSQIQISTQTNLRDKAIPNNREAKYNESLVDIDIDVDTNRIEYPAQNTLNDVISALNINTLENGQEHDYGEKLIAVNTSSKNFTLLSPNHHDIDLHKFNSGQSWDGILNSNPLDNSMVTQRSLVANSQTFNKLDTQEPKIVETKPEIEAQIEIEAEVEFEAEAELEFEAEVEPGSGIETEANRDTLEVTSDSEKGARDLAVRKTESIIRPDTLESISSLEPNTVLNLASLLEPISIMEPTSILETISALASTGAFESATILEKVSALGLTDTLETAHPLEVADALEPTTALKPTDSLEPAAPLEPSTTLEYINVLEINRLLETDHSLGAANTLESANLLELPANLEKVSFEEIAGPLEADVASEPANTLECSHTLEAASSFESYDAVEATSSQKTSDILEPTQNPESTSSFKPPSNLEQEKSSFKLLGVSMEADATESNTIKLNPSHRLSAIMETIEKSRAYNVQEKDKEGLKQETLEDICATSDNNTSEQRCIDHTNVVLAEDNNLELLENSLESENPRITLLLDKSTSSFSSELDLAFSIYDDAVKNKEETEKNSTLRNKLRIDSHLSTIPENDFVDFEESDEFESKSIEDSSKLKESSFTENTLAQSKLSYIGTGHHESHFNDVLNGNIEYKDDKICSNNNAENKEKDDFDIFNSDDNFSFVNNHGIYDIHKSNPNSKFSDNSADRVSINSTKNSLFGFAMRKITRKKLPDTAFNKHKDLSPEPKLEKIHRRPTASSASSPIKPKGFVKNLKAVFSLKPKKQKN